MKRLDRLTARISISSRNAIARAALRLGLAELEADPTKLVGETLAPESRGAKRRRGPS